MRYLIPVVLAVASVAAHICLGEGAGHLVGIFAVLGFLIASES